MIDIYKWAKKYGVAGGSAIPDLKTLGKFLDGLKINIAVEIGTAFGVGTAKIAQHSNKVYTFDIKTYPCRQLIWDSLKVGDKITYQIIENRKDIKWVLRDIDFDLAFIDASHLVRDVRSDWKIVRRCKRVLFHDVDSERYPDNYKFLQEIGGRIIGNNLGYWEEVK